MQHVQQLTEAFSSAVAVALTEMAGVESVLLESSITTELPDAGGISVVIRLNATNPGAMRLSMPDATAALLADRILAETVPNPDETMIRDCIGEVANIIAGQAKTLLYGTPLHFHVTPPIPGDFEALSPMDGLQLKFGSDVGELTLTVHPPTATES